MHKFTRAFLLLLNVFVCNLIVHLLNHFRLDWFGLNRCYILHNRWVRLRASDGLVLEVTEELLEVDL